MQPGMTHRIEITDDRGSARIEFQGLLDQRALEDILTSARDARRRGAVQVILVLGSGTNVSRECIQTLRSMEGLTIEAVSPFLARWLRQETAG